MQRRVDTYIYFLVYTVPCFGVVLEESGLVQRPYLDVGQHVDEAEVPEPGESLPPHLELHRLHGGRAQDAPVPLFLFFVVFVVCFGFPCHICWVTREGGEKQ